jgi:hypothetical protein
MENIQKVKRLNLKLRPNIDKMLRELSAKTGLKLVTIISQGIEKLYYGK